MDNRDEGNESANYIYSLFPVRKINNLFIIYRNLSSIEMLLLAPLTPIVYIYIRSLFESAEKELKEIFIRGFHLVLSPLFVISRSGACLSGAARTKFMGVEKERDERKKGLSL